MAQYRYTGPHPVTDEQGEAVRPLDVRDFDEPPAWGPWELLDGPDTPAGLLRWNGEVTPPPDPPAPVVTETPEGATETPAPGAPVSVPLMTARVAPAALGAPVTPEGM
jgi:hypothetical protein